MTDHDIAGLLRLRQLRELHRTLPQTLVANTVVSCAITAWFAAGHPRLMIGWLILVNLCSGFALHHTRKFRRSGLRSVSARTIRRCVGHIATMAVTIVAVPAWLLTRTSGFDLTILVCLLTGVGWCGALTLAAIPWASAAFVAVWYGSTTVSLLAAAALSHHPGLESVTGDGQATHHLLLAAVLLGGAYTTLRCMRMQAQSFLVSQRQSIELERQGETIQLLLKDFEEQTSDWLWEVDAGLRYRRPSARFAQALGQDAFLIEGMAIEAVFRGGTTADDPAGKAYDARPGDALRRQVLERRAFRDLVVPFTPGNETRWWSLSGRPLVDADGTFAGFRGVCTDVSVAKAAEIRIAHLAHHDALTGLPNRAFFREAVDRAIGRPGGFAVLCLDLDGFKAVNDRHGHPAGDSLLVSVAQRMRALLPTGDVLARFGGDEFMVLDDGARDVEALADRLVAAINAPLDIDGERVTVGACVGIAFAPADGNTVDDLLRNADAALYCAKAEGRGTCRSFSSDTDRRLRERHRMVRDLGQALARDELILHYQPFVMSGTGAISGYEALIRWNHPSLGTMAPDAFIPLAEESGLIAAIGAWVVERACAEASTWAPHLRVAVNISPLQFKGRELPHTILSALMRSGLPSSRLEIEITETALIADVETGLDILRQVRSMGVRVSLDDFGAGYSSLGYLRRFPFDRVKIDRSFIESLDTKHDSQIIVKAIGEMARGLGMTITAEGVETSGQADRLRQIGCEELQGFLYSQPKPASELVGTAAAA